MNTTLTIGVDFNKVVADTLLGLYRTSCAVADIHIPPLDFSGKDCIGREFPNRSGSGFTRFTATHYEEAKRLYFEDRAGFENNARPCAGAVRALQILRAHGYTILLVSDVRGLPESFLTKWWNRHNLPKSKFVLTRGEEPKTKYYSDCSVVVDNDPKHLQPLIGNADIELLHMLPAPGSVGSVVVKRPRNLSQNIVSVRGWDDALAKMGINTTKSVYQAA